MSIFWSLFGENSIAKSHLNELGNNGVVTFIRNQNYMDMRGIIYVISILVANALMSQPDFGDGDLNEVNPCGSENNLLEINKKPIAGQYIREADVAWEKRVWREIDLKEKQNFPLYYPIDYQACRISLFQLISKHILRGNIVAFADEGYYQPLSLAAARKKIVESDEIAEVNYDSFGTEQLTSRLASDSVSILARVTKVRLIEDWYLNKQSSSMEVRIVGMGFFEYVEEKEAYKELFWVYFPSVKKYLAKYRVFNPKNNSDYSTFNDWFLKRQFSSLIIKESNVYDRNIAEYCNGIDALLESDRVKYELFKMEHDWWEY